MKASAFDVAKKADEDFAARRARASNAPMTGVSSILNRNPRRIYRHFLPVLPARADQFPILI